MNSTANALLLSLGALLTLPAPGTEPAHSTTVRTTLWNGRDPAGWTLFLDPSASVDPQSVWSPGDGRLRFHSPAKGYLKTQRTYSDYHRTSSGAGRRTPW